MHDATRAESAASNAGTPQGGSAPHAMGVAVLNLDELEAAARARLPGPVYDYYAGGAGEEATLRGNREAFRRCVLRPRVLVDVSRVDTSVELLGERLELPVLLAPTAFQRLAHPEGELASARAAGAAGTIMVASTLSTASIEETARAATGPLWFQLYVFRDRGITRDLIERAEAAGCRALCLTVTVPVQGNRERDRRNAFTLPAGMELANFTGSSQARLPRSGGSGLEAFMMREFDPSLTWETLDWIRSVTSLPLLIKGVVTPEDALLAVEHGADGVVVSNHGGRQLDGAEPTLLALPRVASAIDGRIPVLVDGGIRRGTDVVKALALGARAVLIGRPYLWGLAADGEAGVAVVLNVLRTELETALALVGRPRASQMDAGAVAPASEPWAQPDRGGGR